MKKYVCFILVILLCCVGVAFVSAENTSEIQIKRYYYKDDNGNDDEKKWFEYYYATNNDFVITNLSNTIGSTLEIPGMIEGTTVKNVFLLDFDNVEKVSLADDIERFDCYLQVRDDAGADENVSMLQNSIKFLKVGSSFIYEESLTGDLCRDGKVTDDNRTIYKIPQNSDWKAMYPWLLEKYEVSAENNTYAAEQGVLYTKDYKVLIDCPMKNPLKEYKVNDNTETINASSFFLVESLCKIVMGKNVKHIKYNAFYGCPLNEIKLNSHLEIIEDGVFRGCSGLKEIILPKSLKCLGLSAFENTGVEKVVFNCKKLQSFAQNKFDYYDDDEFDGDTEYEGLQSWFKTTPLRTVKFGSKIDVIPVRAFEGCEKLKKVVMPKSCKKISYRAFNSCGNLKSVILPKNIKMVDKKVFADCYNLRKVKILGKKTMLRKKSIGYNPYGPSKAKIFAPKGSKAQKYAKKYKIKFKAIKG